MQINEILSESSLNINSPTPKLDVEILLAHVLNKSRSFLYSHADEKIAPDYIQQFIQLLKRRKKGEPIAYIVGEQDFWNIKLKVNHNTLIPRPETEMLVEKSLEYGVGRENLRVLDLGTGSGAIAIALAKEKPTWEIIATDISPKALAIAQENAVLNQVENIKFYLGDWCAALPMRNFNIIISNPPYVNDNDELIKQGDVRFEPRIALHAGKDGLADIRRIIHQAKRILAKDGLLLLEHGYTQQKQILELLECEGYQQCQGFADLAGHDRVVVAKK